MLQIERAFIERRSGKERRRRLHLGAILFKGKDRRVRPERRCKVERRSEWIRVSRYSSAPLRKLKIAKYLLGETRLTRNNPYSLDQ